MRSLSAFELGNVVNELCRLELSGSLFLLICEVGVTCVVLLAVELGFLFLGRGVVRGLRDHVASVD